MRRMKGKLVLLVLLAAMALSTVSAAAAEELSCAEAPGFIQYEAICIGEEAGGEAALFSAEDLAGAESALYTGILNMETSINISTYAVSIDQSQELFSKLNMNYPDLFALSGWWYSYNPSTNTITTVMPQYNMTEEEYQEAKALYNSELAGIVGLADADWSDLEKVLFVHDYLAANYEYDTSYSNYDAYHFFKEKTGVCQAYTMAFMAVMQKLGIDVSYVQSSNLKHVWNLVKLDGSWYHVDVTFDDPLPDRLGCAYHTYFLRSDSGLTNHDTEGVERDWVYGVEAKAEDTAYDNYFWKAALSPFVNVGGTWYYIESDMYVSSAGINTVTASRLMSWDGGNGEGNKTVLSGFRSVGSGLGCFAGKLYFNATGTSGGLYSYDLRTGEKTVILSSTSVTGCRLEDGADGKVLKYQSGTTIEEYSIDPYTDVSGIYGYYWGTDGLSVRLGDSVSVIVASFDEGGRLENIEVFTQAGKYTVSPDTETAEVRIVAVGDTAWIPLCEMLSFAV